jgi:hypothetical protein
VEDERTGMEVGDDAVRDPVPRTVRAAALSVTMFNRLAHRITDRSGLSAQGLISPCPIPIPPFRDNVCVPFIL